jgi:DtxR family transcriptional regulator, Mn-dependent transcriptional regulator
MGLVSDLIDTTEMYLRTIFELTEEGVLPMRARIAERLGQSGPTVSQTVARMQRDGLVELDQEDRHLVLTGRGAELATRVMRKHRLAECLLVDVIGLPWEEVHTEACRWEHVMSEAVERRLVGILGNPTSSPFGNPIPGLDALGGSAAGGTGATGPEPLPGMPLVALPLAGEPREVTVVRISEPLQSDEPLMAALRRIGATPGGTVPAVRRAEGVRLGTGDDALELAPAQALQVIVTS